MVCSSHRINESVLDEEICKQLAIMKDGLSQNEEKAQTFLDFFDSLKTLIGKYYKCFEGGADDRNRTCTSGTPDPKSGASASSATSAN